MHTTDVLIVGGGIVGTNAGEQRIRVGLALESHERHHRRRVAVLRQFGHPSPQLDAAHQVIVDEIAHHAQSRAQRVLVGHGPKDMVPGMTVDASQFRHVLGHFPTGVTVVTACSADGTPVGFTIGSFTSVSLEPPLVGFLPMVTSERWAAIRATGSFCVNVLGSNQGDLCWQFAKSSIEHPFEGVDWTPSPITGSPILPGAIAWIDCRISQVVPAGDHVFVMGRVLDLEHVHPDLDPVPLLFYRGKVGRFSLDG